MAKIKWNRNSIAAHINGAEVSHHIVKNGYTPKKSGLGSILYKQSMTAKINQAKLNDRAYWYKYNRRVARRQAFYQNGLFVSTGFGWSHFVALKFAIMLILILGLASTLLTPELERSPFQSALSIGQVFSEYGDRAKEGIIQPILDMRQNLDWVLDKVGSFNGIYKASFSDNIITFARLWTVPFTFSWYILKILFTVVGSLLWLFFGLFGAVMGV